MKKILNELYEHLLLNYEKYQHHQLAITPLEKKRIAKLLLSYLNSHTDDWQQLAELSNHTGKSTPDLKKPIRAYGWFNMLDPENLAHHLLLQVLIIAPFLATREIAIVLDLPEPEVEDLLRYLKDLFIIEHPIVWIKGWLRYLKKHEQEQLLASKLMQGHFAVDYASERLNLSEASRQKQRRNQIKFAHRNNRNRLSMHNK